MSNELKINNNLEDATKEEIAQFHKNLSSAQIKMMKKLSFWTLILSRLTIVREDKIPTAAVDQQSRMYINPKFFNKLTRNQRCFVLAHECGHPAFMHMYRGKIHLGKRETITIEQGEHKGTKVMVDYHSLWNIAIDYSINMMLYESFDKQGMPDSIPKDPKTGKYMWLFDLKYLGMSAETIFDLLIQEIKDGEHEPQNIPSGGGGEGEGQGQGGGGGGQGQGEGDEDGEGGGEGDQEGQGGGGQSSAGSWNGQQGFDQHVRNSGKTASERNAKEQLDRANWGAVLSHARNVAKAKGEMPAGMDQVLGEMLDSQIAWTDVLADKICNSIFEVSGRGGDFSWMTQNRRMITHGLYMPGWVSHKPIVATLFDTSGSMHNELQAAVAELVAIKQTMDTRIIAIAGDTQVQSVTEIEPGAEIPLEGLLRGGGGTVLKPLFDYATDEDNQFNVNIMVCFTDGYIDDIPDEYSEYDCIWVVFDNDHFEPNFGEVIRVDSTAYTR